MTNFGRFTNQKKGICCISSHYSGEIDGDLGQGLRIQKQIMFIMKSMGMNGPVDGPGWGGASEVNFFVFLPLLDVALAG